MQKRKSLFSLVLVVLVLVLAVSVFVACNKDKPKYTITFDDGTGIIKTITVEEGSVIPADEIPSNPSKLGHKFLGWYNGETKLESNTTFKADTALTAEFERTGYVITLTFGPADREDLVTVVSLDNATFPAEFMPATAPAVDKKAFKGYYNGDVKAEVGLAITGDVTFSAQYYGDEIYTGLYVDEDKKMVAFLEDDYFYFGDVLMSREAFEFNTQTGAFEFPKPSFGTGWTLEFVDGKLNVTKTTGEGSEVYAMTEVVDDVDYAGTYVKDSNSTMTICKGGFAKIGDSTPKYQYLKISADGDGYVLTAVKSSDAQVKTAAVTVDDKGNLTVSDIEKGLWIKDAEIECVISESSSISGNNNHTSITKFNAGNESIYLYKDSNGEAQIVTLDKDFVNNNGEIITVTLQNNSQIEVQVVATTQDDDTSYGYRFAGVEKGTYTAGSQTFAFDGYGKVVATSTSGNGYNGTFNYVYNDVDQLIVDGALRVDIKNDNCLIIFKDQFVGEYTVLGLSSGATSNRINLNGFGYVKANYGSQVSEGSYVLSSANTITITATITSSNTQGEVGQDSSYNGTYTILYDGGTLYNGDTYWCKSGAEDRIDELKGDWVCESSELTVSSFMGMITVRLNNESATAVKVLKPDKSLISFTVDGIVYTLRIGDEEDTLKLTWGESNESIYSPKLVVDEAFYGTWSNDDESIKIKIDEDSVSAYFDNEGTLESATVTAVTAQTTTIVVDEVTYTLSINNGALDVVSSDNTVDDQLQKHIISESKFYGTWYNVDKSINLEVTAKGIICNDVIVDNLVYDDGYSADYPITFTYDGTNYAFYEVKYGADAGFRLKNITAGGDDYISLIKELILFGKWSFEGDYFIGEGGTIVITETSVTFNDQAVENLVYKEGNAGITFTYNGNDYDVYVSGGEWEICNLSAANPSWATKTLENA